MSISMYVILFFHFSNGFVNGQEVVLRSKTILISQSSASDSVKLQGTMDGTNSRSSVIYSGGVDPDYSGYKRIFEPMRSIQIKNAGSTVIKSPRLVFNSSKEWYDLESWTADIFKNAHSEKSTFLSIWKHAVDHRVHFTPPNYNAYNLINMLVVYGYGTCDIISRNIVRALDYLGFSARSIFMTHHTVANVSTDYGEVIIDGDMEVFYLDYDNSSLVGYADVLNDKYLIARTKHYGKAIMYNKEKDVSVSQKYYDEAGPKLFTDNKLPEYDLMLRPGEALSYSWDYPKYYLQDWLTCQSVPELYMSDVIANGKIVFNTNFCNADPSQLLHGHFGMAISKSDSMPKLYSLEEYSECTLSVISPFPILNSDFKYRLWSGSESDTIDVFWSGDGTSWTKVKSVTNRSGTSVDSINFNDLFEFTVHLTKLPIAYEYYVKFAIKSFNLVKPSGLDSVSFESTFQISRFFLPSLELGINHITYSDESSSEERLVEVNIEWKESISNCPPLPISEPVFPKNGQTVDSLYFGFEWLVPTDSDGDAIIDYEFFLSDDIEAAFPLSPNFNLYVSSLGRPITPYFKVLESGWLNDSTPYYWRVRAKDSKGLWSQWSPTWVFQAHGIMQPTDLEISVNPDNVFLTWTENLKGKVPDFYKVYGSNEANGFAPNENNLIGISVDASFTFYYDGLKTPYSFYRVTACTDDGQESLPSKYAELGYFHIFSNYEDPVPGKLFTLNISANQSFNPFLFHKADTIFYRPQIVIDTLPIWLTITPDAKIIGFPDSTISRMMLFNEAYTKIVIRIADTIGQPMRRIIYLNSTLQNLPPMPTLSNSFGLVGNEFKAYISTEDGDIYYGDTNDFELIQYPGWMTYYIKNDTLFLSGIPETSNASKNIIVLKTSDSKGLSVTKEFPLRIYSSMGPPIRIIPNPVTEYSKLIISLENKSDVFCKVFSIGGALQGVADLRSLVEGDHSIDFFSENLQSGTYILSTTIRDQIGGTESYFTFIFIKLK